MSYENFKIGARVEFIAENGTGHRDALKGDVGVITELDDDVVASDTLVTVMTERRVQIRVSPHRLKVLPSFITTQIVAARTVTISDPYAGFVVGAKVRMINENPRWGGGAIKVGDVGVLVQAKRDVENGWVVKFPNHHAWNGMAVRDLELVEQSVVELPTELAGVTLDEAVAQAKLVREEIKALEAKLAGYQQVMTKAGIKFI